MSRLRAVAAALSLGMPFVATAADLTRVASSFEDDDPFGLFIDVGIEHTQHRTHILRELSSPVDQTGRAPQELGSALSYSQFETRLNFDLAAGISQDVEFSFGLPFVLFRNEYWDAAEGANSDTLSRGSNPNGTPITNTNPDGTLANPSLFPVPYQAYRAGFGNARFGLAWAIFNQKRDDTKPTWVARFNYEAPTASKLDPSLDTRDDNPRTPVGDRVHKYTLSTALSRKIGLAEPYFKAAYTIPVRGPGAYSNCENPGVGLGAPENCYENGWDRAETGIQAPHVLGVVVGSEFQVIDNPRRNIRLDVRAMSNFVGAGRYYNEMSGALGKMLYTTEYLQVGGQVGLTARVNDIISIRGSAMFLYNTDHALTAEAPGQDTNEDGKADFEDIAGNPSNRNPSFDYRTDLASRRFFASESRDLRFDVTATFAF
ncbi:hypothetical protein [Melittangium boletus]|uniref:Uncharacterized protein n=1 Tax=Melittangium boletus DSM 14713 TaxID=1294270 RepID=A0A250INS4_9BACT|nr:hypothetical protein [Melittangium boletus]ATB33394.1 hypothetical protein MEBOL_006886 [Melittangium boletus DSM 14713]